MPARLSCPVCRVVLPREGTHCPRCGLRVAALPRRSRGGVAGSPAAAPRATTRRLARTSWMAALQGAAAGAVVVVVAAVAGVATGLAGGPGRAVAGDALLCAAGLLVLVAVLMPGIHLTRWAEAQVMRERAESAHRVGPRRAFVLGAAAACAAGILAVAALP